MKNNPWLAWTDRVEPANATLYFGLTLLAFHAVVVTSQSWLITDYAIPPIGPERRFWIAAFIGNTILQGATLGSLLYLQRAFRQDIQEITRTGDVPATSRKHYLIECAAGLILGYLLNLATASVLSGENQGGGFYGTSSQFLSIDFVIHTQGMLLVHLIAEIIRQGTRLARIAATTKVDLLQSRDYAVFANPMLRVFGLCVVMGAIASPGLLFDGTKEVVSEIIAPYVLLTLLFFAYPLTRGLLIIEKKLRYAKSAELALIERALRGDTEALTATGLARLREIDPQINLLAYEQKIASTWTLPVDTYLRNIVLFALLPVITWVLAALVEILIEGVVN